VELIVIEVSNEIELAEK